MSAKNNTTCVEKACEANRHGQSRFCLTHKREHRAKRNAKRMANLTCAWNIACEAAETGDMGEYSAQVTTARDGRGWLLTAPGLPPEGYVCATRDGAIRYGDTLVRKAFAKALGDVYGHAEKPAPKPKREAKPKREPKPKAPTKAELAKALADAMAKLEALAAK